MALESQAVSFDMHPKSSDLAPSHPVFEWITVESSIFLVQKILLKTETNEKE